MKNKIETFIGEVERLKNHRTKLYLWCPSCPTRVTNGCHIIRLWRRKGLEVTAALKASHHMREVLHFIIIKQNQTLLSYHSTRYTVRSKLCQSNPEIET